MYLDPSGLVALWREALLARAVLRGHTSGYRSHPQLQRFRASSAPRATINAYIAEVYEEAQSRGYHFDRSKLARVATTERIAVTEGQLRYEWSWLLNKLCQRNPLVYRRNRKVSSVLPHPLFAVVPGPVCAWERIRERVRYDPGNVLLDGAGRP
jgi:hypothetical protein